MATRIFTAAVFGLLLAGGMTPATAIDAVPLPEASYQGVPYLSGGIGQDEVAQLEARAKDFDLKLVFAEKSGAYLADVDVVVLAGKDKTVLAIKAAGPIVLAKLPPGRYRLEATAGGKMQRRAFTISPKHGTRLALHW